MIAIYMTGAATLLLLAVPFIPGLRDVPRLIPVHRLIWRGKGPTTRIQSSRRREGSPARSARQPPVKPRQKGEDGVSGPSAR